MGIVETSGADQNLAPLPYVEPVAFPRAADLPPGTMVLSLSGTDRSSLRWGVALNGLVVLGVGIGIGWWWRARVER